MFSFGLCNEKVQSTLVSTSLYLDLITAVPDDPIRIGAVKTLLQWTDNIYESVKVNVGAVAPINTAVRELV